MIDLRHVSLIIIIINEQNCVIIENTPRCTPFVFSINNNSNNVLNETCYILINFNYVETTKRKIFS
jgi:hypothetical protein